MARFFDGTCRLCGEEYTGQGITSHVKRCLTDHANEAAIHHGLLMGVRASGLVGRYWMHILVRPEASLATLDQFLRETWLECCDHPSVFSIDGARYLSTVDEPVERESDEEDEEPVVLQPMSVDIGATIRPRMEFDYLYDPQCPTEVELTVFDPYPCPAVLVDDEEDADIVTVTRNDMPDFECSNCGATAAYVCPSCVTGDVESAPGPFACENCRAAWDADLAPIADSPRMGLCDFEG